MKIPLADPTIMCEVRGCSQALGKSPGDCFGLMKKATRKKLISGRADRPCRSCGLHGFSDVQRAEDQKEVADAAESRK